MSCPVCYSDYSEVKEVKTPCGCKCCSNCLTNWLITQISALSYQTVEKVKCSNNCVDKPFTIENVFYKLNAEQRDMVNEALLAVYIKKTGDIRICSAQGCSYAGTINPKERCKDKLQCLKCGNQWSDISISSSGSKFKLIPEDKHFNEIESEIWKKLFTKPCPSCGLGIQKNGGCLHMNCTKCATNFCWSCGHLLSNHSSELCYFLRTFTFAVRAIIVLAFLWYTGILTSSYIWNILVYIYSWIGAPLLYIAEKVLFFSPWVFLFDCKWLAKEEGIFVVLKIGYSLTVLYYYGYLQLALASVVTFMLLEQTFPISRKILKFIELRSQAKVLINEGTSEVDMNKKVQ